MHKIYIKQKSYGLRGPLYEVLYDGNVIVSSTTIPLFDGARALDKMGVSGPLEMWDHERPYARMKSTVETAAKLTITEGENVPRIRKYHPRPYDANSAGAGEAQDGVCDEIAICVPE